MGVVLLIVLKRKTYTAAGTCTTASWIIGTRCRGRGLCGGVAAYGYTGGHQCDWQLGPDTGDGSTRGACHRTEET